MAIFRRGGQEKKPLDGADLGLEPGERVLASCTDTATGEALSFENLPTITTVSGSMSGSYAAPVGACVT